MNPLKIVGSCSRCSAPIYAPSEWSDPNTAPPSKYSCACPRPTATGASENNKTPGGKVLVE
jgi:hypothetical protein